jgi:hypothetical protein
MNREHAETLAFKYKEFSDWFDQTTILTLEMETADQVGKLRETLAQMLFLLDDAVRIPISKNYPDLFPDE